MKWECKTRRAGGVKCASPCVAFAEFEPIACLKFFDEEAEWMKIIEDTSEVCDLLEAKQPVSGVT